MEAIDVGIDEFSDERSPFVCRRTLNPVGCRNLICAHGISQITYVHIYECDDFSIGVFCYPAGGTLPLHDHPRMTVLSKVLYGSVYIKAYDWVKCWDSNGKIGGLGGMVLDGVYQAPCETSVLFPASGGNIHSFTALTPCAILDVLSPPYSEEFGRPSTYYSDIPIPFFPGYALLEEKELPDDLVVISAPYLGPELAVDLDFC
ncbi:plant cysteine oxidase 2-like isoform X2 [Magnolia sinica]|nr:plant cysteine oxidase 2-like isoform X2 [Magnolia sinica]